MQIITRIHPLSAFYRAYARIRARRDAWAMVRPVSAIIERRVAIVRHIATGRY